MTTADIIVIITSLAALSGSAIAIWRSIKTAPAEIRNTDADAAESSAQAVTLYAKQVSDLKREIMEMEKAHELSYQELKNDNADMRRRLDVLQKENDLLRDWAQRLAHQVQALGGTPVAMVKPNLASNE